MTKLYGKQTQTEKQSDVKTKITRLKPRLKGSLTFTSNENED